MVDHENEIIGIGVDTRDKLLILTRAKDWHEPTEEEVAQFRRPSDQRLRAALDAFTRHETTLGRAEAMRKALEAADTGEGPDVG